MTFENISNTINAVIKRYWRCAYMASLQKRITKGHEYWYLSESKRVNGKVKTTNTYIGNKKALEKFLLAEDFNIKSYSHGDSCAILKIVKKLDIEDIFDEIFPHKIKNKIKRSTAFIIISIQRICCPDSKNALADWYKSTTLLNTFGIKPDILSSDFCWQQMDGITEEELMSCEDAITKKIFELYELKLDKIALDYTNYFTYIDSLNKKSTLAQRGKNKQRRNDLRQFSLAVVTAKELPIPLYSHSYNGNHNDQTEFETYMNMLKNRIPNYSEEDLTFIFDGGSVNKDNLDLIDKYYICRFTLSYLNDLYYVEIDEEININEKTILCKRLNDYIIWGKKREAVLTFSEALYVGEVTEFDTKINNAKKDLQEMKIKLESGNNRVKRDVTFIDKKINDLLKEKLKEVVIVEKVNEGNKVVSINYTIDETQKESIKKKYFGKKLIVTNRSDWSTEEILKTYYDQDIIEGIFKDSKNPNHFNIRPQYHYTDQKVKVHIFLCLVGLMLVGVLNKEIKNRGIKISNEKLIDTLGKIRETQLYNKCSKKVITQLEEMSAEEELIWNIVNQI